MHLHEKLGLIRLLRGLTQEEMADKLSMSTTGYAKIERGETQLKVPRLEKIVGALEMELKDFLSFDEKILFTASFHDESHQNNYVNSAKEMVHELEILRLTVKQKDKEIHLLSEQIKLLIEQVNQLKELIKLKNK